MSQTGFLSKITLFTGFLSQIWSAIAGLHHHYYSKLEAKILEGEESERYKIKKSILLHHCYLVVILSILMPFFNPEASLLKCFANGVSAICQIFILRTKNYALIGNYAYLHAIMNVVFQYFTESEPLTLMGQIFANQHMFFLFPENNLVGKIYIPLILILIKNMLGKMIDGVNTWNLDQIETSLQNLNYSWPLIFLFHHYGAKNLTTSYRLALIKNMQIQKELTETLSLLKKTNKDLKSALKSRELFIASVSHELRNPLNCLIGNIELLRLDIKDMKWLKTLDTCKICCEVLLGQINNVLDVAKINAEKLELHYLPGNFHRLVEKVWSISAIPIKQKKLRGELRISKAFPKFMNMDSHRLTQILLNLIGNASKFTKEGFVSVTITWHPEDQNEDLRKPSQEFINLKDNKRKASSAYTKTLQNLENNTTSLHIVPSLEIDDMTEKHFEIDVVSNRSIVPKLMSQVLTSSFVCSTTDDVAIEGKTSFKENCAPSQKGTIKIDVVDTGCGIPQEALKELFQAFKQADSSITRQFGGTGLGLYITKEIIQKMGGEIVAFSHENVGSNFCVLIPAETAKREDVKEELHNDEVVHEETLDENAEVRALIVDDTIDNQFILSSYLKKLGIHSDLANNGLEAVNMVRSKAPNYYTFITMDLQMPIMDGLNAMKLIRKHEQTVSAKQTPIIVITANCADTEKSKCMDPNGEIRAYNFYRKPFTFDECSSVVQSLVRQKGKKGPKVLIVDDDAFTTTVSQEYMEKHGFQTSACSSGKEALNIVKKEEFDIVLMDCEMPDMNGYMTATQMKKLSPGTLILGVTGHRREECLRQCLDSGMFDVETKPVDFKKIVNLISKIPHQKREFMT